MLKIKMNAHGDIFFISRDRLAKNGYDNYEIVKIFYSKAKAEEYLTETNRLKG